MKALYKILTLITLSLLYACSGPNPADDIAAAEDALAIGDAEHAREICNSLTEDNGPKLSATQLAHISLIYMQLSDTSDDPEIIDRAARCWRDAMTLNTDSAMAFYQSAPVEQQKNVILLAAIVHTFDRTAEMPDIDWVAGDSSAFDTFPFDSIPEFNDGHHDHE